MDDQERELIETERRRLKALVDADLEALDRLHFVDFQLINPFGVALSKDEYLDPIARGEFRYLVWEMTEPITARVVGDAGAVRYGARLSVRLGEMVIPPAHYFHTDYYERCDGRWQVVFSQATRVQPMPG